MPLYEYECGVCGHRFEIIQQRFSADPPVERCPKCGGAVRKLQSAPAIQFKGTGFYITDYARKDQDQGSKSDEAKGSAAGGAAEGVKDGGKDGGKESRNDSGKDKDKAAGTKDAPKAEKTTSSTPSSATSGPAGKNADKNDKKAS